MQAWRVVDALLEVGGLREVSGNSSVGGNEKDGGKERDSKPKGVLTVTQAEDVM